MTKKDYELIVEVLRNYYGDDITSCIAHDLADVFASENEQFDYNKFLEACVALAKILKTGT